MSKERWLKSGRVNLESSQVDRENGIIKNVIMCQAGEAKGHGFVLDQEFISDVVTYANRHHSEIGMKARFGHPSMSNETLGTEMGRFHNFRQKDDQAIADLHLYDSADKSPTRPGMKDWILSMAEEDPNAIMCSIVFKEEYFFAFDKEGNKVVIDEPEYSGMQPVYAKLGELMFCDIVDQGAATDRLFSVQLNKDKFAVIATEFLNEHPELDEFVKNNPDKIIEFVNKRKNNYSLNSKSKQMKFKSTMLAILAFLGFSQKVAEEDLPEVKEDHLEQLNEELARLQNAHTELTNQLNEATEQNNALTARVEELESDLANERSAFEAFRQKAAADPSLPQGTDTVTGGREKQMAPWNQEGFAYAEKYAAKS